LTHLRYLGFTLWRSLLQSIRNECIKVPILFFKLGSGLGSVIWFSEVFAWHHFNESIMAVFLFCGL